jgi:hypothetical protein
MPDEMDDADHDSTNEDRQRDEVKQRIQTGVIGESLWSFFSHDEGLLAKTCQCSRGQFSVLSSQLRALSSQLDQTRRICNVVNLHHEVCFSES